MAPKKRVVNSVSKVYKSHFSNNFSVQGPVLLSGIRTCRDLFKTNIMSFFVQQINAFHS